MDNGVRAVAVAGDTYPSALLPDGIQKEGGGVGGGGCYLPVDESADAFDRAVREYFSGDCLAFARAYYRREAWSEKAREAHPAWRAPRTISSGVFFPSLKTVCVWRFWGKLI